MCRYYTDPSGTFWQCNAKAIGSGSEGADSSLQEQYNKVSRFFYFSSETVTRSPNYSPVCSRLEVMLLVEDVIIGPVPFFIHPHFNCLDA